MRCRLVRATNELLDEPEGNAQGRAARRDPRSCGTRLFDPEVEVENPSTKVLEALTPPKASWMRAKTEFAYSPLAVLVPQVALVTIVKLMVNQVG